MIDFFRAPIAQIFELNEFIKNFQIDTFSNSTSKSLLGDLCVHIGELIDSNIHKNNKNYNQFNKHSLPEFNCLYLSPANFWHNSFENFKKDDDIMYTINSHLASTSVSYSSSSSLNSPKEHLDEKILSSIESLDDLSDNSLVYKLWNKLYSILPDKNQEDKSKFSNKNHSKKKTSIRDLLFGVSWSSVIKSLDDDQILVQQLNSTNLDSKSIVLTYAITIALKNYDREFLSQLKLKLEEKINIKIDFELNAKESDKYIYNIQYIRQSAVYYIPYIVLYLLLFVYIYISVSKIEFVKSKWGLAFAAVAQVIASLLMAVGICSYFGLTPTLNGGEIFPYLIIFIGFENIVVLTKSVVSTPFDLDVRYRIAFGLKKESWNITKILSFELIIIFFGICTMVPAIQEFCVFAFVGLLIDFFMQMIFFVTVLSIDIRRMELSDLTTKKSKFENMNNNGQNITSKDLNDSKVISSQRQDENNQNLIFRRKNDPINPKIQHKHHHQHHHHNQKSYKTFFTNKSVQFFYFWAKTRMVQRAMIALSVIWIILIFYKSLLIVELMRHDVNVKKETVEQLLPKGVGLPKLIKDNFQQFLFTSTKSMNPILSSTMHTKTSTIDYFKNHFENFLYLTKLNYTGKNNVYAENQNEFTSNDDHSWRTLPYYHWLTLFSYYNVSLYNRYVAILPQINLYQVLQHQDILKYRNLNEIVKYNSLLSVDGNSKFVINSEGGNNNNNINNNEVNQDEEIRPLLENDNSIYRNALYELFGIVILGKFCTLGSGRVQFEDFKLMNLKKILYSFFKAYPLFSCLCTCFCSSTSVYVLKSMSDGAGHGQQLT